MSTTTTTQVRDVVAGWLEPYDEGPKRVKLVEPLERAAELVADALRRDDDVTFTLAVGNGYQYRTAISMLPPEAEADWGGNMLVSLPEFNRCLLLNDHGGNYHMPSYVEEKIAGIGEQHSTLIAGFLTLLSAHRQD